MRSTRHSVKIRLVIWHSAVLAVILCSFSVAAFFFLKSALSHQMNAQIDSELERAVEIMRTEPSEIEEIEEYGSTSVMLCKKGDAPLFVSPAWIKEKLPFRFEQPPNRCFTIRTEKGNLFRIKTERVDENREVTVGRDEQPVLNTLKTFAVILLLIFPAGLAVSGLGGYLLAGKILAPVRRITEKAEHITADNLSERLPINNPYDEFGRLANVFNSTLARLEDSFDRLRGFTADASHELRTPLTAIRSVGEVALQEERNAAEYRDCIGSMLEETNRVTRLVDNLLTLTRAERGAANLHPKQLDAACFLARLVDNYRILAEDKNQRITQILEDGVTVEADEDTLRLAVANLLDNAIKYTQAGGEILISLYRSDAEVHIEVADNGPGIPVEHRERIFDRFYRIERSRSPETGGTGLGLAIALQAIKANRGRIEVASRAPCGSLFRITLTA